jgi:serine/threonine protein kinase
MLHEGIVKIGDFGSAEHLSKLDQSGQYSVEGFSKWYMAPEMLFGRRNYGPEVDIWAFGCIFAELLVGLPLFTGKGEIDQIIQIANLMGSPTEDNWPEVKKLPDFGKIKYFI